MEPAVGKERGRCWGQKRGEGAGEVGPRELGGKEVRGHVMVKVGRGWPRAGAGHMAERNNYHYTPSQDQQ